MSSMAQKGGEILKDRKHWGSDGLRRPQSKEHTRKGSQSHRQGAEGSLVMARRLPLCRITFGQVGLVGLPPVPGSREEAAAFTQRLEHLC